MKYIFKITLLIIIAAIPVLFSCVSARKQVPHTFSRSETDSINNTISIGGAPMDLTQKLSPSAAQTDLALLKQILEEAQTSIYTYSTKKEVDIAFDKAFTKASDPISYIELVRAIAEVQYTIACGHSSWEHSSAYVKYRNQNIHLFPFDIAIVDGRYYIKKDFSREQNIPDFTEITHINGKKTRKVTAILKKHMNRDGFSNPGNTIEVEQYFKMAYSNFIGNPEIFALKTKDGKSYLVKPLLLPEIDSIKEVRYGKDKYPTPLQLNIIDSANTAVYTIVRFSNEIIRRMGQEFVPFTDSVFGVLNDKKIDKLVIDLRGNRGGWTANGLHLLSYFIDKPVPYLKRVETKKYKDYTFQSLITENAGYDSTMMLPYTGKYYEWTNNPNLLAYKTEKNHFNGKIFILVDGFTRSASSVFCALAKKHTAAVIVGEELTAAHCGTSGMVMSVRLPYSGIGISFSTARYHFAISDSTDTRGLMPDIKVLPDLEHARGKKDVYMEWILSDMRSH